MERIALLHGDQMRGYVFARDAKGNVVRVTSEEYSNGEQLTFHTKGMVRCHDIEGVEHWVTSEEYHNRTDLFHHTNSPLSDKHPTWKFKDTVTGADVTLTKQHARELNKQYRKECYEAKRFIVNKRFIQQQSTENKTKTMRSTPKYRQIGEVVCWDTKLCICRTVLRNEFENNDDLVGVTDNMATVRDPSTGLFMKMSSEKAKASGLRGPNVGKANVIDVTTGIKKQIDKKDFDRSRHIHAGTTKLLLTRGRNGIHYLEWKYGIKGTDIVLSQEQIDAFEASLTALLNSEDAKRALKGETDRKKRNSQIYQTEQFFLNNGKDLNKALTFCSDRFGINGLSYIKGQLKKKKYGA